MVPPLCFSKSIITAKKIIKRLLVAIFICSACSTSAQVDIDTIGNTIVEISVAVDTSHFLGGYMSGPWDLYWGPDNKLWYTNINHLCRYDPVSQITDTLLSTSGGFMMGVTADKDFFQNPYVYICIDTASYYAGGHIIQLYRYEYSLSGDSLFNPQYFLEWYHPGEHSGGRIIHGIDDKLYISTAEYWVAYDTLFSNNGKVLRVNTDGTVPVDNPKSDYTYSYGHRNPQGIVQVPNGNIFVSEYGQQWDELNLILPNRHYGWIIYDGTMCFFNQDSCNYYDTIVEFPLDVGLNPPSGIDFYNHNAIPEFNGLIQAVTGALKQGIIAYTMNASYDSVMQKSYYLTQKYGRVRDVCSAPDGSVYFIAHDRNMADIRVIRNPLFNEVKLPDQENSFSFFPNPVSGDLFLNFRNNEANVIFIHDLSGKQIYSQIIQGKSGIVNVENISAGCYFISAKSDIKNQTFEKLIIVK